VSVAQLLEQTPFTSKVAGSILAASVNALPKVVGFFGYSSFLTGNVHSVGWNISQNNARVLLDLTIDNPKSNVFWIVYDLT
jgi:hypothetical protein